MTLSIGWATGLRPTKFSPSYGSSISVEGTILGSSVNEFKARRQQLLGMQSNTDELFVPVVWVTDSTLDGYYAVSNVTVQRKSTTASPNGVFGLTLTPLSQAGNAAAEVTVQSVVRTNVLSIATMAPVVAYALPNTVSEDDFRFLSSLTSINRPAGDDAGALLGTIAVKTKTAAISSQTTFRTVTPASTAYVGACQIQYSPDGGATWFTWSGRQVPLTRLWRITNGHVRLTSANGATPGKLEVYDSANTRWESTSIQHSTNTSNPQAISGPGIGLGTGSSQPTISIAYNSPELVAVKCNDATREVTYSLQRGAMLVVCEWASIVSGASITFGVGPSSAVASTTVGSWGNVAASTDGQGNKPVYGYSPNTAASTVRRDVTNGWVNNNTADTKGVMMMGVVLDSAAPATGNAAADLGDQFFGLVSWSQRMVRRS